MKAQPTFDKDENMLHNQIKPNGLLIEGLKNG